MPKIVPAILEETQDKFLDMYSRITKLPGCERIQVDFGDGVFVPHNILPVTDIDTLNPAFHWEAHLMLKESHDFLDYQICGFKTIIVHYEAYKLPTQVHIALQKIKSAGMEPVLCLNPETEVELVKEFTDDTNHFQIMGVNPGYQGAEFLEETFERIAKLRKLCPNAIISVDGGINETNIKKIAEAGADLIVVGSALTKSTDMVMAWEKLNASLSSS